MESGGGGGGSSSSSLRRTRTFADQAIDASNLRDLLRVRDDEDGRDSMSGLTLGAVLGCEKRPAPVQVNRTLLDIIRDESSGDGSYRDLIGQNNRKSWKSFKDRLRLRRAGAAWTSSVPVPASDVPIQNCRAQLSRQMSRQISRQMSRRDSVRVMNYTVSRTDETPQAMMMMATTQPEESSSSSSSSNMVVDDQYNNSGHVTQPVITRRLSAALAAEREQQQQQQQQQQNTTSSAEENEVSVETEAPEAEVAPVRMSLMALLEETDRQAGVVGSAYAMEVEDLEEEERGRGGGGEEGGEYSCCVCMVRHKGAAFIPCGHTFCRLCSRELWVSRGNCPLCNGFILEILDIF